MALDVYFKEDIANVARSVMIARYGTATPNDSEFMNALDSVGAAVGLERIMDRHGGWWWIDVKDNKEHAAMLAGK